MKTSLFCKRYFVPILIAFVVLLAYSNTFTSPFQFDDDGYIVNNPALRTFHYFIHPSEVTSLTRQSPTSFPVALKSTFVTRILGHLSFALNYRLHGLNVVGYHVVNLVLHILNGILVYLILMAVLRTEHFSPLAFNDSLDLRTIIPIASSLLFVSHPIQTQAVTYISQRFVSLGTFFYLLSLLLYVDFRTLSPGYKRYVCYITSLVSAVAAMLTKEFTFTLPIIVALFETTFFSGRRKDRIRTLAPFAATLLIIPSLIFFYQGTSNTLESTMRSMTAADETNISKIHYLLTQFRVVILYIRLFFYPVGQNVDHAVPVNTSLFDRPVIFSFILLLVLFFFGVYLYFAARKKKEYPELKLASFGIIWFFITLSVESSIIPLGELVAEYRIYLPCVGMIAAVVSLAVFALRRFSRFRSLCRGILYGFLGAAVMSLTIATYVRNTVWASEISLWEDAAKKSPAKIRPLQNLGMYYSQQGRLAEAEEELRKAIRIDPRNYKLHNNLGIVYRKQGDLAGAIREYSIVLQLQPTDPMAYYNIGNIYLAQGNLEGAIREYQASIRLAPDYDESHNNLGIAYEMSGQFKAAIIEYKRAIGLNSENVNARNNLAMAIREAAHPSKK
jgi:tetratricopeptide (TPR) repeat protein